jgi:hypothetical protein
LKHSAFKPVKMRMQWGIKGVKLVVQVAANAATIRVPAKCLATQASNILATLATPPCSMMIINPPVMAVHSTRRIQARWAMLICWHTAGIRL